MINYVELSRQAAFLIGLVIVYFFLGWQMVVVVIAVGMGFVFDQFVITTACIFGALLHGVGLMANYLFYSTETNFILEKSGILMGGLPQFLFPLLSILFPVAVYALAAFFSIHLSLFIKSYKP